MTDIDPKVSAYRQQRYKEVGKKPKEIKKSIGCHHDSQSLKTNYLKTNLLKQIKNIFFSGCKVKQNSVSFKVLGENFP
jgi:hypothetical protein